MNPVLLCIDTHERRVRRYVKNYYGNLWSTHEFAIVAPQPCDIAQQLESVRLKKHEVCAADPAPISA